MKKYRRAHPERIQAYKAKYQPKASVQHRDYWQQRVYGISPAGIKLLVKAQGGKCPGCLRHLAGLERNSIDHNHATGKVRGFLCHKCNAGMGILADDASILRRLADYLDKNA
jgi:hypothetical protein